MPSFLDADRREKLVRMAETFAVGAVGGISFNALHFPAGFLSGAMVAVAAAALGGRPTYVPLRMMQIIMVLVGISLGAVVTPETLHGIATYPLSIAVLIVTMAIVSYVGAYYLQYVHKWDRVSAFLGAAPGGLSQVMSVAAELGADLRGVAIVQTMRVVIVAVGLPAGLAAFSLVGPSFRTVGGPFNLALLPELTILIVSSTVVAIIAYRVRFPGGLLFGAMLTSAALHGTGYIHAVMPWWAANTAMIALGSMTGSRFGGTTLRMFLNFILSAFGSMAVTVAISLVAAVFLVYVTPFRIADVMIAFAPGSVDAMMLLALALNIDPVYVGAHHLVRIFFVSMSMPLIARRAARLDPDTPHPRLKMPPNKPPFQD